MTPNHAPLHIRYAAAPDVDGPQCGGSWLEVRTAERSPITDNTDGNDALPILPPTPIMAGEGKKREAFWLVAGASDK